MENRLGRYEAAGDHRAVFQRDLAMTREMGKRLDAGFFDDQVWMERVLVGFAGYYFSALGAYDQPPRDRARRCSPAWQIALDATAAKDAFVLEDAVLGINAHINNDLPIVMAEALKEDGAWPDARRMLRRRRDHDRVNEVLGGLVDAVQDELTSHYARLTGIADRLMGCEDECLSGMLMAHSRMNVWQQTECLLDASTEAERSAVRHTIEQEAYRLSVQVRRCLLFRAGRPFTRPSRRWRLP